MTREEIISMVPGSEMDRLVAEKVMGFITYEDFPVHAIYTGSPTPTSFRPWQPSIHIATAWEVVERYLIEIIPQASAPSGYKYLACITDRLNFKSDIEVFGDTAPEAICKAALIAVVEG